MVIVYNIFFSLSSVALFTRGHEAVKDEKVIEVYRDTHLPMDLLEADHKVCYIQMFRKYVPYSTKFC